jgi:hypothetical protein
VTHTQEIATGSTVLAAWDSNRFIDLPVGLTYADIAGPYVTGRLGRQVRLGRWTVVEFSELTGSYALVAEGATGPGFLAERRNLIPVTETTMSIEQAQRLARQTYDPALPATRDHQHSGNFVSQDLPVLQAWRDLAPFLALPDKCSVSFYCEAPDVPDRVHQVFADLDPASNRGYVRCQLSLYGGIYLTDARGTVVPLLKCWDCGSPWCVHGETGYGTTINCPDCGHSSYCDRGDLRRPGRRRGPRGTAMLTLPLRSAHGGPRAGHPG